MFIKTFLTFINIKNMEVTDQIIIDKLTVFRHNKIQLNTCRIKESWLKEHGLYEYLTNRFKSVKNIQEIIYRIYYKLPDDYLKCYSPYLIYKKRD